MAGECFLKMYNAESCSNSVLDVNSIITGAYRMMHEVCTDNLTIFPELADASSLFWHPWIDFYSDMRKQIGDEKSKNRFIVGLKTGAEVLTQYSKIALN